VVKIGSLFGTTAGFGALNGYRLHESLEIYKKPARLMSFDQSVSLLS
jgi:hypothetical protein